MLRDVTSFIFSDSASFDYRFQFFGFNSEMGHQMNLDNIPPMV